MPVMDGIVATSKIRKIIANKEKQPWIFGVTGHVSDEYKEKGIKAGMNRVLSKPLYKNELEEVL